MRFSFKAAALAPHPARSGFIHANGLDDKMRPGAQSG